jgi:CRP/FNR family transcriptional regulator
MINENMLGKTDLFRDMEPATLERLKAHGVEQRLSAGEVLFLEGAQGTAFYLIEQGTIRLSKSSMEGQEVTVRLVEPGEIFAEVILFENPTYPVNAVAVTASTVLAIPRAIFLAMLDDREFRNRFITNIMRKQRYLAERIRYLTTFDVEQRFFRFLLERYGRQSAYTIELPKKDISAAIGTIPETFSRLIQRLKLQGVLEWEGANLKVAPEVWELYET